MKSRMNKHLAAALVLALGTATAQAVEAYGIDWSGSGFLTLAAGQVLGGTKDDPSVNPSYLGYKGPHYIADWAQGAVYEDDGIQLNPGSRIGLQGTAKFSPRFSITGQVVARGARNWNTDLEWLYGTYKVTDNLSVQLGRKRLPILYYSESQDVGFSYPWVHLPPDLYGWQVVNYNGASVTYSNQLADWTYTANVFAGSETNKDTGYQKMYNGKWTNTNVRWTNIVGGELFLSKDWFEGRIGYFESDAENGITGTTGYNAKYRQKISTLGFVIDYDNWVIRNEYYEGNLSQVEERDYAQIYAVGYRIGKFLPMFTYANYYTKYVVGGPLNNYSHDDEERHDTRSLSLRYDLTTSSSIKVQYDAYRDRSGAVFRTNGMVMNGDVRLLTVSYDKVF